MSSSKSLIIIPCFNEAKRLPIEEFTSFFEDNSSISFLFIDDGSSDNTLEILHTFKHSNSTVEVLSLNKNQGKAEAIRNGILQVNEVDFDYVGYFDADLATPLNEIYRLLEQAKNESKPYLIIGSRVKLIGSTDIQRKLSRHYIGRIFATIVSNMLKLPIYDTQCGAKLIRSDIAKVIFKDPFVSKWLFDVELIFRTKQLFTISKNSICEVPLKKWIHKSGSKISLFYYFIAPIDLLKIYFKYRS